MAYISKATLLSAYTQLSELTNDPTSQGATQIVSAIRYFFALDEFVKKYSHPCNTQDKADRTKFVECVDHIVSLYDNTFTVNFYSSLSENLKSAIGSNFYSVGSVKNSLENNSKEFEYPKRSGWLPLFVIKNGLLEKRDEFIDNINSYLNSIGNRCALVIWLCRKVELETTDIYSSILTFLQNRYSKELIETFVPSRDEFIEEIDLSFQDSPAIFCREDFPQTQRLDDDAQMENLLPPDELAEKVKESFFKFWQLIDQHGADFNSYVNSFEEAINPCLTQLNTGYSSVFQIVDYNLYSSLIKRISQEVPDMSYIANGRQNTGKKYTIGSTHLHYSNYLKILANSDFRANMDKEQAEYQNAKNMSLLDQPLQLIYYGAPGTGKSFTIDKATNENNSVRTTFHPDSDYAGFVGAYKPTMENVPMSTILSLGTEPHAKYLKETADHPGTERKIVYKYVPQAFLKAYVEAWKRYASGEPYYLVIEEINRGNCAQIFGDLFQLLDRNNTGSSSYAISADEDIAQFLREDKKGFGERKEGDKEGLTKEEREAIKSFVLKKDSGSEEQIGPSILDGSKLLLPPNLRIWATMNTSDQSLFPIDSAFKRRWNWEYISINTNPIDTKTQEPLNWKLEVGNKLYTWGSFLDKINPLIDEITQSEDKQMGYFFAKPDKDDDTISTKVFVNKVLFYLWTDVFKDYDLTDKGFVYEDTNEKGEKVNKPFKFRNFFPIEGNDMLVKFVNGLGLTEVGEQENTANTDAATKRAYGRSLVVKFPDGTQIKGDTQFETYLQALERIGLDNAFNVVAKKGYSRNQAPLISKEKFEAIENSPMFSYVQSGEYYIIKGIDTMEGTLKGISKELGLNLEVFFE